MRSLVLLTTCLIPSTLSAQLDRFEDKDIGKLAVIAKSWQQLDGFNLTPEQYDTLSRQTVRYRFLTGPDAASGARPPNDEDHRRFLNQMYEVLTDKQEQRLHEVFFQRFMNRDELKTVLQAFAPGEVDDLDSKLKAIQEQISAKLGDVIGNLPEIEFGLVRDEAKYKVVQEQLIGFLDWRWKLQTKWLGDQLGEERAAELIGEPILIGYRFLVSGDPKTARMMDAFGGPAWGGSWYGSGANGMSRSGRGPDQLVTLGVGNFDPVTGKVKPRVFSEDNRYGRIRGPKPPVRVPDGMTLADAEKKLVEFQSKIRDRTEETGKTIAAMRKRAREIRTLGASRESMKQQRQLEAELRFEVSLLQVDVVRFQRIIEELGGDPFARQKAIRAARLLFSHNMVFRCGDPTFLQNVDADADQCDALEQLGTAVGVPNPANDDEMNDYIQRVRDLLNPQQAERFDQLIFRSYWFSERATRALDRTGFKPTNTQIAAVRDLVRRYEKAKRDQAERRRRVMLHLSGGMLRDDSSYLIAFAKEFSEALADIVGHENADNLIGKPTDYSSGWKRPIKLPKGMTLEKAEAEYAALTEERTRLTEGAFQQLLNRSEQGPVKLNTKEMEAKQKIYDSLSQRIRILKRIVEELKKRDGHSPGI